MTDASIEKLVAQLLAVGFPAEVKTQVRLQLLFHPEAFELVHRLVKGSDQYQAVAFCTTKDSTPICTHYEVTLRRYSSMPPAPVNGVDLARLDASMKAIDWKGLAPGLRALDSPIDLEGVENVLQTLAQLAETEMGAHLSAELKLRYWEFTPLQKFIAALPQLKSSIEISQRYFLFDGGEPIKLEEAFRFLNHRWQERKFQTQAKKASKVTVPAGSKKGDSKKQRRGSNAVDK